MKKEQVLKALRAELNKSKYNNRTVKLVTLKQLKSLNEVNTITVEQFKSYIKEDKIFLNEYSRNLRRLKEYKKTLKDVKFLEVHAYAPELNKIHLKNDIIMQVPRQTTIKKAVKYLVMTHTS